MPMLFRSVRPLLLIVLSLSLARCGRPAPSGVTALPATVTAADSAAAGGGADPLAIFQNQVFSTGPKGEQPTPASAISLSEDELRQIREQGATAAILMHYRNNDWAVAQFAGLADQFGKMGISIVAATDANFEPARQIENIETALTLKPDIIVSFPTDTTLTAAAFQKAAAQGVTLVFMDNVPEGMQAGKDYVSVVSADNYGNGMASAYLMAAQLGNRGPVGVIYHTADSFVTTQRYEGFKATIGAQFPEITIVAEEGISGPDFTQSAETAATTMIKAHPEVRGIWVVWDIPAEAVMTSLRAAGRTDIAIITQDLGKTVAVELAQGGMVKGLSAQRPYDQGVTEALLAGYGLLGKTAPPYVVHSALPVTRETVQDAWRTVYHQEPLAELMTR